MTNSSSVYVMTHWHIATLKKHGHEKCHYCGIELQIGDQVYRHNKRSGRKYHKHCAERVNLL